MTVTIDTPTAGPACDKEGCTHEAVGVLAIEFYPPAATMEYYGVTHPLTSMVCGLNLCEEHAAEIDPPEFLGEHFEKLAGVIEKSSGTAVDRAGAKAVLKAFEDPMAVKLRDLAQKDKPQ